MYSNRYSYVPKHSPMAQKKMQYKSKGKSCGYYLRIVFFFSSLIQSLIIVSLVLFLIYGDNQDSASLSRIQDLEESFSRLSIENVALRRQRKNLTMFLNTTLMEKAHNDWELSRLRYHSNISIVDQLQELACPARTLPFISNCDCGLLVEQMKARIGLLEANYTQTSQRLKREMDHIAKDRDNLNLEAIGLRRDKLMHEKEAELCKESCKTEFVQSLSGISNVTNAFLNKINSLFPTHLAFQISCEKQRENLERIQSNCTSLSRDMEEKFQYYLDNIGGEVSSTLAENSRLKAENWRLFEDYRSCSQNRSGLSQQHRQDMNRLQEKHDQATERLLMEKKNLNGEITVLNRTVHYKNTEPATPFGKTNINNGWNLFSNTGGGSSSSSSSSSNSLSQSSRIGAASSSFNSGGSSSSSASSNNKPVSNGGILSFFGSNPSSSSSGSGSNKPGTGKGSTTSSYGGSAGSNLGSTGLGSEKSLTNAKTSSGSEASSSGSASRTSFPWFGTGRSTSLGSKSGSGTEKGPSGENGDGGHPGKFKHFSVSGLGLVLKVLDLEHDSLPDFTAVNSPSAHRRQQNTFGVLFLF
uniref:Plasmalemma vesicle associated protein a n=1 Tax=Takifugu rubripes TaxID=31033 RepID=H2T982_TAKRU